MSEFRMFLRERVRHWWLRAQGVPENAIFEKIWRAPLFEPCPPHCVVCGRAWRPDEPAYISVYGRTRRGKEWFTEWHSEHLDLTSTTGIAPGETQIRRMCREHGDRWRAVPDCLTGETVELSMPPTCLQRAWRDAVYWCGSGLRFVFLVLQWIWLWLAYKTAGHRALCIRSPWPPLRKAS